MSDLRIVSLIPSATEIVHSLGLSDRLVGRSHECDFPESVRSLPACTQPQFDPNGSSPEIHDRVTELLQSALSVYRVETELLRELQPTHIITQAQCEVCAASLAEVEAAVAQLSQSQPKVISLQPSVLAEVWENMRLVGEQLGSDAEDSIASLKQRVEEVRRRVAGQPEPSVVCIEWTEPLMSAGNWVPELVQLAGGVPYLSEIGQHSPWTRWESLEAVDPDVIVVMPCGYDLQETQEDAKHLTQHPVWPQLKAVQTGRVYYCDGNQYFNRPGPRLVDSLELLAEILHPSCCDFGYRGTGFSTI
ncbi:cobalamin-binding protein [Baaleninema sp.]|uniref:cobalamin-binding protein n=1 Tax=Baaleninema sp. TaxID=3101197 RepID=UPI003D05C3F5